MRRGAHALTALITVTTVGVLTGCGSAVRVAPLPGADTPVCAEAAAAWPGQLDGLERRETAVQTAGVAAWGEPPIIARCGGEPPGPSEERCIEVDGVDWLALPLDDGVRFVTYGRSPTVEVLIPEVYGTSSMLADFDGAVQATAETGSRCS